MSPGRTSGGKPCPSNDILKQEFLPILNEFLIIIESSTCKKYPGIVRG